MSKITLSRKRKIEFKFCERSTRIMVKNIYN